MTSDCQSLPRPAIDAARDDGLLYAVPATENNPRGIPTNHRGPGPHLDCVPKLVLTCSIHRGGVAYCWVPDAEVEDDLRGRWICDPCLSDLVDLMP